jgi:hypothetical protein
MGTDTGAQDRFQIATSIRQQEPAMIFSRTGKRSGDDGIATGRREQVVPRKAMFWLVHERDGERVIRPAYRRAPRKRFFQNTGAP